MRLRLLVLICTIAIFSTESRGQDGLIGDIDKEDTVLHKIDSITTFIHTAGSKLADASEYDVHSPNGLYAIYTADTVKGELRQVNFYTYDKNILHLLTYYYYNQKVIKVTESRSHLVKKQDKELEAYYRTCYYWNDTLHYAYNPTKEPFYYQVDLATGKRLLDRFQSKYALKHLNFNPPKNRPPAISIWHKER